MSYIYHDQSTNLNKVCHVIKEELYIKLSKAKERHAYAMGFNSYNHLLSAIKKHPVSMCAKVYRERLEIAYIKNHGKPDVESMFYSTYLELKSLCCVGLEGGEMVYKENPTKEDVYVVTLYIGKRVDKDGDEDEGNDLEHCTPSELEGLLNVDHLPRWLSNVLSQEIPRYSHVWLNDNMIENVKPDFNSVAKARVWDEFVERGHYKSFNRGLVHSGVFEAYFVTKKKPTHKIVKINVGGSVVYFKPGRTKHLPSVDITKEHHHKYNSLIESICGDFSLGDDLNFDKSAHKELFNHGVIPFNNMSSGDMVLEWDEDGPKGSVSLTPAWDWDNMANTHMMYTVVNGVRALMQYYRHVLNSKATLNLHSESACRFDSFELYSGVYMSLDFYRSKDEAILWLMAMRESYRKTKGGYMPEILGPKLLDLGIVCIRSNYLKIPDDLYPTHHAVSAIGADNEVLFTFTISAMLEAESKYAQMWLLNLGIDWKEQRLGNDDNGNYKRMYLDDERGGALVPPSYFE